jgi:hypothetical protein
VGLRLTLVAVIALATFAGAGSASSGAPPAGTPDPRMMVLTSGDLGGARVSGQKYFKDPDFPSAISYVREFTNGTVGRTQLAYVESEADVGKSAAQTAAFLVAFRKALATADARRLLAESFRTGLGEAAFVTKVRVGRPRNLGVTPGSFDVLVTARLLGRRVDFHLAVFAVERVLGIVSAEGNIGRSVPLTAVTRIARIQAARTVFELVPQNIAAPTISGSPAVRETLAANPGRWTGNPRGFSYAWHRCDAGGSACKAIRGATARSYVVTAADVGSTLRVAVKAHGAITSDPALSSSSDAIAVFLDTFDTDRGAWTLSTTGTGPRAALANGRLELTLPTGTVLGPEGYAMASALTRCRLTGDFDMQVDYRLLSGLLPASGMTATFAVEEYTGSSYSATHGMFVHNAGANNHGISTHFPSPPGVFGPPYNAFVSDFSTSGTLRLVRTTSAGVATVTASRRTGPPWSFTSLPYTPPTSQAVNLHVFTNVPVPTEVRVAFDNLRITSGTLSCP